MSIIQFDNGTRVNFDGTPTPEDVDFVAQQLGILKNASTPKETPQPSFMQKTRDILSAPIQAVSNLEQKAGRFLAPTTEDIGRGIAAFQTGQEQDQVLQTNTFLADKLMTHLKDPNLSDQRKTQLVKMFHDINPDIISGNPELQQTAEQIFGRAGETALNIGTLGTGAPATYKAAARAGTALGAGFGASKAMQENKSPADILKAVAIAAPVGAVAGVVGKGLVDFADTLLTKGPKFLAQQALGKFQTKDQIIKEVRGKQQALSDILVQEKIPLNESKIYSESLAKIDTIEQQIQDIAQSPEGQASQVSTQDIITKLKELTRKYKNVFGANGDAQIQKVKDRVLAKGETISNAQAQQLKRDIHDIFAHIYDKADPNLSQQKSAYRAVADALRHEVAKNVPEIDRLNKEQSKYIRIADAVEQKLAAKGKQNIVGLTDMVLGAGFGGNIAAEVGAVVAKRTMQSTPVLLGAAKGLRHIGDFIDKLPTDAARRISKDAVMNLIGELGNAFGSFSPESGQQPQ